MSDAEGLVGADDLVSAVGDQHDVVIASDSNDSSIAETIYVCLDTVGHHLLTAASATLNVAWKGSSALKNWLFGGAGDPSETSLETVEATDPWWTELQEWLGPLSDFQLRLLQEFSVILAGNVVLVVLAWRLYGPRITERFLARKDKFDARLAVEEVQSGISELKLPREQDFRVK